MEGPVDLELGVEPDDDTVELWLDDGSEWKTVEGDTPVTDVSVETAVDRNGTYAPGTDESSSGTTSTPTPSPTDMATPTKTATPTEPRTERLRTRMARRPRRRPTSER